jgi:hypothetical protein
MNRFFLLMGEVKAQDIGSWSHKGLLTSFFPAKRARGGFWTHMAPRGRDSLTWYVGTGDANDVRA